MTTPDLGAQYAARAAEVAAKLKPVTYDSIQVPGTYDSIQALALVSIAQSLAKIAENMERSRQS